MNRSTLLFLMMLAVPCVSNAQKKWRTRQQYRMHPPKVVLVKISTYTPQIRYYNNIHQQEKSKNLKRDIDKLNQKMVQDFNANFRFRPFYYFYDTNAHYITEGKPDGILLDKNLQPATRIQIAAGDTNFLVVCNGVLMSEDHLPGRNNKTEALATSDNVLVSQQRLIVLDHNLKQMPKGTVRVARGGVYHGWSRYRFNSKRFNLFYGGKASILSSDLDDFYGGSDFNK